MNMPRLSAETVQKRLHRYAYNTGERPIVNFRDEEYRGVLAQVYCDNANSEFASNRLKKLF